MTLVRELKFLFPTAKSRSNKVGSGEYGFGRAPAHDGFRSIAAAAERACAGMGNDLAPPGQRSFDQSLNADAAKITANVKRKVSVGAQIAR